MADVWERMKADPPLYDDEEPAFWFNRFDRFYRAAGPDRSILGAYKLWLAEKGRLNPDKLPKRAPDAWYENSRRWNWQARAEAWDEHLRRDRLREEMSLIAEMNEQHLAMVRSILQMAARRLNELLDRDEKGWQDMTINDVLRYTEAGVKMERLLRGLPTDAIEAMTLSDDELLRKYHALLRQIAATGDAGAGDETAWPDTAVD